MRMTVAVPLYALWATLFLKNKMAENLTFFDEGVYGFCPDTD
jgi:hypothetical protein